MLVMGEETDIGIASVGKSKKKLVDKSPIKGLRKGGEEDESEYMRAWL